MTKYLTLIFCLFTSITAHAELLLSYDFDDGTAQGWTLTGLTAVSTEMPRSGGYSVKVFNGEGLDKITQDIGATLDVNDLYVRYYWYTQSWDDDRGVKFFRSRESASGGTTDPGYIELWISEGFNFLTGGNVDGEQAYGSAWPNFTTSSWQEIIVHIHYEADGQSDGYVTVSIDGTQVLSETGVSHRDGDPTAYAGWIAVTGNPGTSSEMQNSYHFIDDIEIWDSVPVQETSSHPLRTGSSLLKTGSTPLR